VTELRNTWGAAVWSPAFADLLHECVMHAQDADRPLVLGDVFDMAVRQGLKAKAVWFPTGSFADLGTTKGLFILAQQSAYATGTARSAAAG